MSYEVKVTRQCQTTIPRAIRKKYGIDEGDSVIYIDLGDHIAIVPVSKHPIKALKDLKIDVKESVSEMRQRSSADSSEACGQKIKR